MDVILKMHWSHIVLAIWTVYFCFHFNARKFIAEMQVVRKVGAGVWS